jgi:parvulin-like peptidyl-prolyl isomerase
MAKRTKQSKELTKKQIALSRRQKEQQRWIFAGLGVVAIIVLGLASAALIDQLIIQPSRPVAIVNGARIRSDAYHGRVRYERFLLDTMLRNLQSQLAVLDPEDPSNSFVVQYYQQVAEQAQQQRLGVDRRTADDMVEEELARQEAAKLGLAVSQDEINEEIRSRIASMSGFLTEAQATAIASTAVAATATADTFTPTPLPPPTSALTVTLVTTATPTVAPELPTPAPTPTRHIITDEEFSRDYADYLSILKEQTDLNESEFQKTVEAGLLVNKVYEHLSEQVPTEAEQVNISHIQLDTLKEAETAIERLDSGEDFAVLASEVSTDTFTAANGGELGWFLEGDLSSRYSTDFEEAAFSLSPGEYSQPISSTLGLHIIKLNERGLRPLSDFRLQDRQQQAYSDWLEEARNAEGVEVLWEVDMAPPDPLFEQPGNLPAGGIPFGHSP